MNCRTRSDVSSRSSAGLPLAATLPSAMRPRISLTSNQPSWRSVRPASRTADWIAADADTGRLAQAVIGGLVDGLVGQRTGAGHDADLAGLVDETGHDADLALLGRDDAGAVRTDQPAVVITQRGLDAHHVEHRDALRYAHHQLDAGIGRFEYCVGRKCGRHIDHADVGPRFRHRIAHGVVDRHAEMLLATFARCYASDNIGSVINHLAGMKGAFLTGKSLYYNL